MSTELNVNPEVTGDTQAHIDAMVAKNDGVSATPEAAPEGSPERPAWLPEKFATPEAMAAAYASLEGKLGGKKEEAAPVEAVTSEEATKTAEKAVEAAGLDMASLEQKVSNGGTLDDSDFEALEKAGISRAMATSYIEGQQALGAQIVTRMHETVGGEEAFNNILTWAGENLSPAEVEAFNGVVDTGTEGAIKLALEGLNSKYRAAGNNPPRLLHGDRTSGAGDVFRSTGEMTKAMSDPRYARDAAYRADVMAKLGRSNIL